MPNKIDIINEARKWLGIPWRHQGRTKKGIDCIGLILNVGKSLGLIDYNLRIQNYSRLPDPINTQNTINQYVLQSEEMDTGDILWIKITNIPMHFAFYDKEKGTIIHSFQTIGKVAEQTFDNKWRKRLHSHYRFIGIE